jgi:ABC-type glycerol-3-phosphate transport system permease component
LRSEVALEPARTGAIVRARARRMYAAVLVYGFLVSYLIFVLFPLFWLMISSLKTRQDALALPPRLIFTPTWDAWEKVFTAGILQPFGNSFFVAITNIVIALVLAVPAAYALARMRGPRKERLSFWILSTRMAPAFGIVVPVYTMMRLAGLLDTRIAVTLAHLAFNLPFAVWLLMRYFEDVPLELEEAALVDGATRWGALRHAVLPPSLPMVVAVGILIFVFSWNEFILAFILTSTDARTVPALVASLAGTMSFDWPLICAVSTGAMLPAFLLVFLVQQHITRGLTLGAVQ